MFRSILRESRRRKWKSTRKWQKAKRKQQRLEDQLQKAREVAEPDRWFNAKGLVVGVHVLRNRYRGTEEYRFEFFRKDGTRYPFASDFGERDLDALIYAIQCAKRYRDYVAVRNPLREIKDRNKAKSSKSKSWP